MRQVQGDDELVHDRRDEIDDPEATSLLTVEEERLVTRGRDADVQEVDLAVQGVEDHHLWVLDDAINDLVHVRKLVALGVDLEVVRIAARGHLLGVLAGTVLLDPGTEHRQLRRHLGVLLLEEEVRP